MTTGYSGFSFSLGHLVADVDMNNHQYKFVTTASSAGKFKLGTGASGPVPLGVLQNDPRADEPGEIRVLGTSKVAASGTIAYGDFVTSGSHGLAILTATAGSNMAAGIALTPLSSGYGVIEVLLMPGMQVLADNA